MLRYPRLDRWRSLAAATLSAGWLLAATPPVLAATRPAVSGQRGVVVTPDADASRAGLAILQRGGNAIDAAIAASFVLSVSFPTAGALGGGGFLLYREPGGAVHALDFREVAPAATDPSLFVDADGRPIPGIGLRGGLAIGVPGTVAGLAAAHERWGSRPWRELVRPAIELAESGFLVAPYLASEFARAGSALLDDPAARRIFAGPDGTLPRSGERLRQPDLARTLRRVSAHGAGGFYRGPVALELSQSVRDHGGRILPQDLETYAVVDRRPLEATYRGYRVITFPPPSGGGVVLLQSLGILESFDLRSAGFGSSLTAHLMVEAQRRAYADRSRWLGDPAYSDVPVRALLDRGYLGRRSATIDPSRATPSSEVAAGEPGGMESPDTLHLSIGDARGAAVALTSTLNTSFGSGIIANGTGVLLNNQMDDFALAPGVPNGYGLLGGEANAIQGGKRPLSSMTPTIVERAGRSSRPFLVLGSPGGATIVTSVLQVLSGVVDHGLPLQEAVDAPRIHHQWFPDEIRHETRALPADVARALQARGHRLRESDGPLGDVNAIGSDESGTWFGAADPRRGGTALAW